MDLFNITQMFHRYCHGCPELEIELIEPEKYYAADQMYMGSDCTIKCKHYELCERLMESIRGK